MNFKNKVSDLLNSMIFSGGFWVFILALLGAFSLYAPSKIAISSNSDAQTTKRALPIYSVETSAPKVSLSFDSAWGNENTAKLLNILKDNNVYATFFVTGGWVDKYPEDVKSILANGNELGNHSNTHKHMTELSNTQVKNEIMSVNNKVKELTGTDMILFRIPYGDYNNKVINTINSLNLFPIQWDVDSLDWKNYSSSEIVNTVLNNKHLRNGSIILMHNGGKYTPDALNSIIKGLKEKGYEIVPISQLIYKDSYVIDTQGRQISTKP